MIAPRKLGIKRSTKRVIRRQFTPLALPIKNQTQKQQKEPPRK